MVHPPNIGHALPAHLNAPEAYYAYYVLDDEYQIWCGKEVYHAQQGDFVFILKRYKHKYQSSSNGGGEVLIISPACLEMYFREIADTLSIGPITWK